MAAAAAVAGAQTGGPVKDPDLIGLTTTSVLEKDKAQVGVQVNSFGASDNLLRAGFSFGYGFGNNFQARIASTFSAFDSFGLASGNNIRYGGSAGDFLVKYRLRGTIDTALELGIGYSDTPAQEQVLETVASLSAGYAVTDGVRLYVNPKLVTLLDNPLFAVGVGAVVDVAPGISLFGDWTPYVSGNNTLSTTDGSMDKDQLYAVGIRFTKLWPGLTLDLAYTNIVGETYGFSLTPSLGNTGGLYVGLAYGF